jgi:hypothetical protein
MPCELRVAKLPQNGKQQELHKRTNNTVPLTGWDITPRPFFTIASEAGEVASKPPSDPHGIKPLYRHLYHLQQYNTAEMKMEKPFFASLGESE